MDFPTLQNRLINKCHVLLIMLGLCSSIESFDRVGDYCARIPPEAFTPRSGSANTLRSVQVLFRHGTRGDHQKGSCFQNHAQTRYSCRTRSVFGLGTNLEDMLKFRTITSPRTIKVYEGPSNSCSQGQLLDEGIVQISKLGKVLKSAYPMIFTPQKLRNTYLYSTDTQRTFATMHVLLSHIYPRSGIRYPFEVNTREFADDFFALNIPECKRFVDLRSSFHSTSVFKELVSSPEFRACEARWEESFGTPLEIKYADDCLLSSYCSKTPLPGGDLVDPQLLSCVTKTTFELRAIKLGGVANTSFTEQGQQICQLGSFHVLESIRNSVFNNNDEAGLYSIHDETYVCLLISLGIWDGIWPRYASFIVFEFHSDGVVRVVRDGKEIAELEDALVLRLFKNNEDVKEFCRM